MRIVSLACSNTEIVCALGCGHRLVGVDNHSDFPAHVVDALPRVGPDLEIDIEEVKALNPDLVLETLTVPGHERVVDRLEAEGLPFVAPEPETLNDVYRDVRRIGELLGVPDRAATLVRDMKADLGSGIRSRPHAVARILVQWWPKPTIAPGSRSWTTDVIRAAGARNVLENEPVRSRPVPDGEVVELDPDAIVISWCGVDPGKYRPDVVLEKAEWRELGAVARGDVYCVPEAFLGRPGPRLVEGVRALREIVEEIGIA